MSDHYVVVTNCTSRKRAGVPLARLEPSSYTSELAEAVRLWRTTLASQPCLLPAGRLYVGRSINEARTVSEMLHAKLYVISAGLGLVPADCTVPGYDLSATGTTKGLHSVLERCGASIIDWWRELTGDRGVKWLLSNSPTSVVLLALPADYLRLVRGEFESLSPSETSRLRVFTSVAGARMLAHLPQVSVMPYDERLESVPNMAGTRSDFPQRALRHFVCHLGAHQLPTDAAHREVEIAMSAYTKRIHPARRRLTDAEVCDLIRKGWQACGGNSARLLRYLRDDEKVACEQGRFAKLRHHVSCEFGKTSQPIAQGQVNVS